MKRFIVLLALVGCCEEPVAPKVQEPPPLFGATGTIEKTSDSTWAVSIIPGLNVDPNVYFHSHTASPLGCPVVAWADTAADCEADFTVAGLGATYTIDVGVSQEYISYDGPLGSHLYLGVIYAQGILSASTPTKIGEIHDLKAQ